MILAQHYSISDYPQVFRFINLRGNIIAVGTQADMNFVKTKNQGTIEQFNPQDKP